MRAKYAAAIRYGIKQGKKTRYGDEDDPYYELRSEVLWRYFMESRLRELALSAFTRTWRKVSALRVSGLDASAVSEANAAFERAHTLWTESRQERELRLLREEVVRLRKLVEERA